MNKTLQRNMAVTMALVALGGKLPIKRWGLSAIQHKVLLRLRNGKPNFKAWREDHPNFDTVVLPLMLERQLIKETKEHPARPKQYHPDGRLRLPPIEHEDIDITEEGLLTLYRRELISNRQFRRY